MPSTNIPARKHLKREKGLMHLTTLNQATAKLTKYNINTNNEHIKKINTRIV